MPALVPFGRSSAGIMKMKLMEPTEIKSPNTHKCLLGLLNTARKGKLLGELREALVELVNTSGGVHEFHLPRKERVAIG